MRLFYATDVHGSDRCFTKFVNAGAFYDVDVVLLGGDLTGKAIVPLIATSDGHYRGRFLGEEVNVEGGPELTVLEKKIANTGYYAYPCEPDEEDELQADASARERLFLRLMRDRLERWVALAEERLKPTGIRCLINAGNDDPPEIDSVLGASDWVEFLEGRVVRLADSVELASCGYANRTPWDCPRDIDENQLAERIDAVIGDLDEGGCAIFNFHCPPYDTGIDAGPKLDAELRMTQGAGGMVMVPVGSTACREAIERYQPVLGLHGHLHESRGITNVGRTVCINPGSEYTEGVLRGALVEIKHGKLASYQLTTG